MELIAVLSNPRWTTFGELLAAHREQPRGAKRRPVVRPRQRRLHPNEIEGLVVAYQAGEKIADLVSHFGIGRSTVKVHLRRRGVAGRPYRQLHGPVLARAQELYAQGWSLRALEAELGLGREAIRSGLRQAGVRLRPSPRDQRTS